MSDLINQLREPELHYPGNFDTVKRANAMLMCMCQEAADALEAQAARITALEKIIQRQQFIEDRYEELMLSCRRVYRYYGADTELFNASVKVMDFLIRRHATEIDEMNEEQE